jgi:hypothetical protein
LINQAEKRLFESEKESHTLAYENWNEYQYSFVLKLVP